MRERVVLREMGLGFGAFSEFQIESVREKQ